MFIFDEVQTGVGMTGKMWAHEYYVEPDMMSFGKKLQVCGFVCSKRVDEVTENVFQVPSRINSTFGGNLVDMVRATRMLEIIQEEDLVENARTIGMYLLDHLLKLEMEFPSMISNTRGLGLFCAIDIDSKERRELLKTKAFEKGLILIGCGERTVRFRPPLNISSGEIDEGVAIIRRCLYEITD